MLAGAWTPASGSEREAGKLLPAGGTGTAPSSPVQPDYILLDEVQAAFSLDLEVDPVTRVHRLRSGLMEVSLCPGMAHILVDQTLQRLPMPVLCVDGKTLVPGELARLMRGRMAPAKPSVPTLPRPQAFAPEPRIQRVVVIDAGHGGKDPGAISSRGLQEKEVTLGVVERLGRMLEARGHRVILTRSRDHYLTLKERVELCQREQPDLFVSIHINSSPNRSAAGFETYFSAARLVLGADGDSAPKMGDLDRRLGDACARLSKEDREFLYSLTFAEFQAEGERLARAIQASLSSSLSARLDRGVKPGRWYVVRWSQAPAVLVELGFLSHAATESQMKTDAYREQLAQALLRGIESYF